ncbi:putative Phage head-tail connector protein [uncultured delta proteobacterium]|uniref:Putative Phage head-tail connector protein n=1 Tax=uncultured delta proteobacterium TaxID=34034 RepID=A0A212JI59_9DELT|nr:putative Phage head-tail connector protein [uncultured delta proteobacterium]
MSEAYIPPVKHRACGMDGLAAIAEAVWKGRETIDSRMEELARYIYPDRQSFAHPDDGSPHYGLGPDEEGRREIWDGTPEEAAQMLSAALGSLLTNPAASWFRLELADGDGTVGGEAGEWLTEATRLMLQAFADPATGFQNEVNAFYMDLPVFGWGVFWSESRVGEGLRFRALSPAQCAIAENAAGQVDTIVRRYTLTASQMIEEFGDRVSDAVKRAAEKDPQKHFGVTHLVMPREKLPENLRLWDEEDKAGEGASENAPPENTLPENILDDAPAGPREEGLAAGLGLDLEAGGEAFEPVLPDRHPFISVYYETADKRLLHAGGYFEPPFQAPRWAKRSGEVYGRGPGHAALPDIRVLNAVAAAQLTAAEKQADPPLLVPDDGVLGKINTHSGGITYYTPGHGDRIATLPVAVNLEVMEAIITKRQEAVRRAFLNDRIQMAGGPQMTATEVAARERKQMLVLGPVLGRLQSEFLGPLVARTFALLYRAGRLPAAPESIRGRETQAKYVSPIARAQKQGEAESFAAAMSFIMPVVQANPDVLANFDGDAIVRDTQDMFGYPQKYLRDAAVVAKERKEAAEAMQPVAREQGGA